MDTEDLPPLESDEEFDDDEEDWTECNEEEEYGSALCLFCSETFPDANKVFSHCQSVHAFDMAKVAAMFSLNCFSYIKLVNFIRAEKLSAEAFLQMHDQPWEDDKFMKPVIENDALLQFDIEELPLGSTSGVANSSNVDGVASLVERLREAEIRAKLAEEELARVTEDFNHLRSTAQNLIQSQDAVPLQPSIATLTEDEDEVYFGSYGHFSIHQEMLKDEVRTLSYHNAVYDNKEFFQGKTVLDIGCGTGILSMFAARAGAKQVISVDMSDIIYQAMDIVRENGLEDKITLLKGRMEDVDLPVEKVDIIISEWMGYFLLFESMLDSVLWARDRYLQEGGALLPSACSLHLALLADKELHQAQSGYWDDVYGFSMRCMRTCVLREASVAVIKPDHIASTPCVVKQLDLMTCRIEDLDFTCPFVLTCQQTSDITAFVGYFDIGFDQCPTKVQFSTGPDARPTHWKQTVFLLEDPISLTEGEKLEGVLTCQKNKKDPRSLMITIQFHDKTLKYLMQ